MTVISLCLCFLSGLRLLSGEREPEGAAPSLLGFDPDAAAQPLDDMLADGQPESRAVGEGVEFDEAFEHLADLFGGDAAPGVGDEEAPRPVGQQLVAETDGALLREFHRIAQQVGHQLHETVLVGAEHAGHLLGDETDFHLRAERFLAAGEFERAHEPPDVGFGQDEIERVGFDFREVEDVVD